MNPAHLQKQLEELNLLQCSLMPGETLHFVSANTDDTPWPDLLAAYSESGPSTEPGDNLIASPACFQLRVDSASVWFEIELPLGYPPSAEHPRAEHTLPQVSVRGDQISRSEHERWQAVVKEKMQEVRDSEYVCISSNEQAVLPVFISLDTLFTS